MVPCVVINAVVTIIATIATTTVRRIAGIGTMRAVVAAILDRVVVSSTYACAAVSGCIAKNVTLSGTQQSARNAGRVSSRSGRSCVRRQRVLLRQRWLRGRWQRVGQTRCWLPRCLHALESPQSSVSALKVLKASRGMAHGSELFERQATLQARHDECHGSTAARKARLQETKKHIETRIYFLSVAHRVRCTQEDQSDLELTVQSPLLEQSACCRGQCT